MPRRTFRIAYQHFEEYEKICPERYEEEYGYFRKIITSTICKYLDCGIMENGFTRARCPDCGYDFFVAFSCKTRFFCPSCSEKRTLIWGEWVKENVLKNVAHRQWVFTIPKVLRKLFYKDRLLLVELARCAAATILELYKAIFPDNHFRPGIIASTQTFGDLLIWHPPIHCKIGSRMATIGNHQFALTPTGGRYILIVIQVKEVFHVQNAITETAR